MSGRRIGLCAVLVVLAVAPAAAAKEGVMARITTDVPTDAAPGETFRMAWTLQLPDGRAFSALPVFVRLHGADGASTTAIAEEQGYGSGVYVARATVPTGGMEHMQIGLRGSTEVFFEIEDLPEGMSPMGDPDPGGSGGWTIPLVVIGGTAALVLVLRRIRPSAPVATR
jgi:hypothetical protein